MLRGRSSEPLSIWVGRDSIIIRVSGLFILCFTIMPIFTPSTAVWKRRDSEKTEIKIDLRQEWSTVWSLIVYKNLKISLFLFGPGA